MSEQVLLRVLGLVGAVKGVDVALAYGWWLGLPLLATGLVLAVMPRRRLAGPLAAAALVTALTPAYWNHLVLLFWVALTVFLLPNQDQRALALRWTLSIMYGFAAAAKLWPDWLSGEALRQLTTFGSLVGQSTIVIGAAIVGTIVVEVLLAVGVWRTEPAWWWLALSLHLAFVVAIRPEPVEVLRLVVFGVLSLATWAHVLHVVGAAVASPVRAHS